MALSHLPRQPVTHTVGRRHSDYYWRKDIGMNSAAIISLASLIPGLGLWLLGKRRDAVIAAVLVWGAVLLFFFSPWQALAGFSCYGVLFLWLMQVIYTTHEARLAQSLKTGSLQQAKEIVPIVPPSDLSRGEKIAFTAMEIVRQQVEANEHVLDAIRAAQSSDQLYYIGLLTDKLILVSTDFLGKPAGIMRIDFSSIQSLSVKNGSLSDKLIVFSDGKNIASFTVARSLRVHTDNFAITFTRQKSLQV